MATKNARNFFITMNEAIIDGYDEVLEYLKQRKCNYYRSCMEINKREKLHIHIYVQFPVQVKLAYSKCCHADVEVCRGTEEQNIAYINYYKNVYDVDSTLDEYGTLRHGCGKNQHTLMAAELKELPFDEVPAQHYRTWQSLQGFDSVTKKDVYKPDVHVWFVYGPSGAGKSKWVFDHIAEDEPFDRIKYQDGYWHNVSIVNQPETAWLDEFRSTQMPPSEFINFIDYYVNAMNMKYHSGVRNKYKKIYITSIENPKKIYKSLPEETRKQWMRRIDPIPIGVPPEEEEDN